MLLVLCLSVMLSGAATPCWYYYVAIATTFPGLPCVLYSEVASASPALREHSCLCVYSYILMPSHVWFHYLIWQYAEV